MKPEAGETEDVIDRGRRVEESEPIAVDDDTDEEA
jgi:hypothetical protein